MVSGIQPKGNKAFDEIQPIAVFKNPEPPTKAQAAGNHPRDPRNAGGVSEGRGASGRPVGWRERRDMHIGGMGCGI